MSTVERGYIADVTLVLPQHAELLHEWEEAVARAQKEPRNEYDNDTPMWRGLSVDLATYRLYPHLLTGIITSAAMDSLHGGGEYDETDYSDYSTSDTASEHEDYEESCQYGLVFRNKSD